MASFPMCEDWQRRALALVVLLWAGILFGVSFLATPAKFAAPSLTLPVAVDVGRATFPVLNRAELVLAAGALALGLAGALRVWRLRISVALAVVVLAVETFWLLPELDSRAAVVVAGGEVPASNVHTVYIALDAVKFVALLLAGAWALGVAVSASTADSIVRPCWTESPTGEPTSSLTTSPPATPLPPKGRTASG